jgi:RNA polymerase sigma-70 factor, ECF subfamily
VAEETWDAALDEPLSELLLDAPQRILDQCDTELSQAVQSLSPDEQAVLLLHVIGDFKYREVADILGMPMGTVISRLARSRVRLQIWLVEYGVERGILRREEA